MTPWTDPGLHAAMLLAAVAWDRWLGEPPTAVHPVVWMGRAVRVARAWAPRDPAPAFVWGLAMAVGLPLTCAGLGAVALAAPYVGPLLGAWLLTSCFAIRGLGEAGLAVAARLEADDLPGARARLSWLCSRDASALDATAVAAGALESVAENSSDSAIAPLLWFAVGGLPAALAYRCVNTLDAMIGYHGETEWLGKASARLDDLANLVPARWTAVWLLLFGLGRERVSVCRGARLMWRDRRLTESPNAGWPMSAMAGLVGVALEKRGHYLLGGGLAPCDSRALRRGVHLAGDAMTGFAALLLLALGGLAWTR